MSLRNVILSEVGRKPGRASDIHARLQERMGDYWPVNDGQVFQVLSTGVERNLVSAQPDEDGRPIYALTDAGRNEVTTWLSQDVAIPATQRHELYLKLDALDGKPPEGMLFAVEDQLHKTTRSARHIRKLLEENHDLGEFRVVALQGILTHLDVDIEWLTDVRKVVMSSIA